MSLDDVHILTVRINNHDPIELLDLTNSLLGLGAEYRKFAQSRPDLQLPRDPKLYVREVRSGSVVVDLDSFVPAALFAMEHGKDLLEYAHYLDKIIGFLRGERDRPELDRATLSNVTNIVEPVAKDHASQMNIGVFNNHGTVVYQLPTIDSQAANAIQNVAKREADNMLSPLSNIIHKELMYWERANAVGVTGDKGVIESVQSKAVRIVFDDEAIKHAMIHGDGNPFHKGYIVDASIQTVEGKPVAYKILRFYEVIDLPT